MHWPTYGYMKKKMENEASGGRVKHERTLSIASELMDIFERDLKEIPAKKTKEAVSIFIQNLRDLLET